MNFDDFQKSLSSTTPPAGISGHLLSLWHDARNDWESSHEIISALDDSNAAWIHAYLHRKEGDGWNADYWYSKAGKKRPHTSLEEEWNQIAQELTRPTM